MSNTNTPQPDNDQTKPADAVPTAPPVAPATEVLVKNDDDATRSPDSKVTQEDLKRAEQSLREAIEVIAKKYNISNIECYFFNMPIAAGLSEDGYSKLFRRDIEEMEKIKKALPKFDEALGALSSEELRDLYQITGNRNRRIHLEHGSSVSRYIDRYEINMKMTAQEIAQQLKEIISKEGLGRSSGELGGLLSRESSENHDQLREENEIIDEVLKTTGVNLMIHMMVNDRQDWKGVYKENIWQSLKDEILPGDGWQVLHHNKLKRVDEDNAEYFHDILFLHENAPTNSLRTMNLDEEHMVGWHADNEQIRIWKPETDSTMDKFVKEGSSKEKVYCYTHLINAKPYKYYDKGSDIRIIAAMPESVAKKVYFAIKRNPEFRKRMVERLLKDNFPALAKYKPGVEYGEWKFDDSFKLALGKDVQFDAVPGERQAYEEKWAEGTYTRPDGTVEIISEKPPEESDGTVQYAPTPVESGEETAPYEPEVREPTLETPLEDPETAEILNSAHLMQKYANAYIKFARAMSKGKNTYKKPSLKEISDAIGANVHALSGPDLQYCIGIDVTYNGAKWIMVLPNLNMIRAKKFSEGIFKGTPDTGKEGMPAKFCLVNPIHGAALIFDIKEDATIKADKKDGNRSAMLEELESKRVEAEKERNDAEKAQEERETSESRTGSIGKLIKRHRKKIIAAIGIAAALHIFKDDIANIKIPFREAAEVTASSENEDMVAFRNFQEALDKGYIYKDVNGEYMPKIGYVFANEELPLDINNPSSYAVKRIQ